jgi:hypothetical protein
MNDFSTDIIAVDSSVRTKLPPFRSLQSPPNTPPATRGLNSFGSEDAPLFDTPRRANSVDAQVPLFRPDVRPTSAHFSPHIPLSAERSTVEPEPERPYAGRYGQYPQSLGSPYSMTLDWTQQLNNMGASNALAVLMQQNEDLSRKHKKRRLEEAVTTKKLPEPRRSPALERDQESARQLHALTRSADASEAKRQPKMMLKATPKMPRATPAPIERLSTRPARKTPQKRRPSDDLEDERTNQSKHKRAPPTKKLEGADSDWNQLPDYCPPMDAMTDGTKLKVHWKANPMPIENEPDFDQLSPDEQVAASELRLKPQQYLANKRRLFQARVKALNEKKIFNKTLAQNAMKIDVNKASKMWEMYDKVGWLEERLFEKYREAST